MLASPAAAPVNLRLSVSREEHQTIYMNLAVSQPQTVWAARDPARVPPAPERIQLRTGDRIRIQVSTDLAGYVTLFNIGPTGNLHLL
jgi:hypothetical protein